MTENTDVTNDSVFNTATGEGVTPQTPTNPIEGLTGTVAEYVGEGKKFRTVEALAASYVHSQEFIETLKTEKQEILSKVDKLSKADEVFDKLLNQKADPKVETLPSSPSLEDIEKLMATSISKAEVNKLHTSNLDAANETLVAKFGSVAKASEYLKGKALELGLSEEYLVDTAKQSPTAFYNVLGVTAKPAENNTNFMQTGVNTGSNFNAGGIKEGSEEYFAKLYREDKKAYFSPKVQKAIMDSATNGTF